MGHFARSAGAGPGQLLGFPASLGAAYMDYIIADRIVIPEKEERFYTEKVVALPHSTRSNDASAAVPAGRRSAAGAWSAGRRFRLLQFQPELQADARDVSLWVRMLKQVEGSVLWLLESNRWLPQNLRAESAAAWLRRSGSSSLPPFRRTASGPPGAGAICFSTPCLIMPTPRPATRFGRACRCSPASARLRRARRRQPVASGESAGTGGAES